MKTTLKKKIPFLSLNLNLFLGLKITILKYRIQPCYLNNREFKYYQRDGNLSIKPYDR